MKILGIESSADETAAAVIKDGTKILSSVVASSMGMHEKTGGIIPEMAAREQIRCILPVIKEALEKSQNIPSEKMLPLKELIKYIDAIAVTIGPGLIGSLLVGVESAKTLALLAGKPIIPVNHIFAHLYANWLIHNLTLNPPKFPALGLVVSGGHTELFYLKSHHDIKWLGGTRDDAAGEAFDKTARLLGLGFPGGPAIAASAAKFKPTTHNPPARNATHSVAGGQPTTKLPRPMIHADNLEFSFAGLKTAVLRETEKLQAMKQWNNDTINHLSYEIQEAITDVLVSKVLKALEKYPAKSLLIGGGVAANKRLTEKFQFRISSASWRIEFRISLFIPPPSLCTDNAAYIASYAFFHPEITPWEKVEASPNLQVEV